MASVSYATYAEQKGIYPLLEGLMRHLVVNQPKDVLSEAIAFLKRDTNAPRIVIYGPPMAGSRTLAYNLAEKARVIVVDIAAEVKKVAADSLSALGKEASPYVDRGEAVPNNILVPIVVQRLREEDCVKRGFALVGLETREQALALQTAGVLATHFFHLYCANSEAATGLCERLSGCRVDPKSGRTFHTTYNPPPANLTDSLARLPESAVDSFAARLEAHERAADGVLAAYKPVTYRISCDQPPADVLAKAYTFLNMKPRVKAPIIPRLIILGPVGAGKATLANLFATKYGLANIDVELLVKREIAAESKVGQTLKPYVSKGLPPPDAIVCKLLERRLTKRDCISKGFVLRGLGNAEQARSLLDAGVQPNGVFVLQVPLETAKERICLRRVDPKTGQRFHMVYAPPAEDAVRDRVLQNPADHEDVVQRRYLAWSTQAEDMVAVFADAVLINADQEPHNIFESAEAGFLGPGKQL